MCSIKKKNTDARIQMFLKIFLQRNEKLNVLLEAINKFENVFVSSFYQIIRFYYRESYWER